MLYPQRVMPSPLRLTQLRLDYVSSYFLPLIALGVPLNLLLIVDMR